MDLVERTWEKLGFRIRATGYTVIVRTRPHAQKVGSLWLPPKAASFHGELPHLRTVYATVLSSGPVGLATSLKPGDVVAFKRLEFGWLYKLSEPGEDEEYVGYIDANHVVGIVEDGDVRSIESTEAA